MNKNKAELKLVSNVSLQSLKLVPLSERLNHLPNFMKEIIAQAVQNLALEELIVFGSRARGDEKPLSDWDLCFKFPQENIISWMRFSIDLPEKADTLLEIDAVNWDEASDSLKANILAEGLTIWKKTI